MDFVLEVLDHYIFDDLYAKILPASLSSQISPNLKNLLDLNDGFILQNSTLFQETLRLKNSVKVNNDVYGLNPYLFEWTTSTFNSLLPRHNLIREFLSLWVIVTIFGLLLYFSMASMSYLFVFDKTIFNHPRYLKNQMALEIQLAASAIPVMSLLTVPWFLLEINGHSKLYFSLDFTSAKGIKKNLIEMASFIFFTDCGIYLCHRWLHWPRIYKALHKPHHKWLVCTPFASHSFHPVDGYAQSLSYHLYPIILPLNKLTYLLLFTFVNFWTVMIHDGNHMSNNAIVNGTACHTVHHLYFNYNYGQFTTLWDRLGGSYRKPDESLFGDKNKDKKTWEAQEEEIESYIELMEDGDDDRVYNKEEENKKFK
ncbi:C-5 sterol desaturase NDAI_0C06430 [Naumovozyma dairenensis CBS 421]|uniref:Fatty acid hydroxylase domain-containing protein n=1 Tax=Naumovozyma dairenensis (strain ATCC 10597 / BCRC 20456 / CBS 421 / NBRC 0211 / NRRL Y-12639) TaxID=1071378 RepID=G0W941_NAUDC|nr:hypothetical protein NDAI_0C06430 [Naumovozyma dairenensis CBS 421]CCD24302.1 hypothetical protein NDAI_0C06430 [Naumovozyma dairenensis CBS 421]